MTKEEAKRILEAGLLEVGLDADNRLTVSLPAGTAGALRVTVIVGVKTGLIVRGGALTEKQVKAVARAQMRKDGITEAMVRAYMYTVTPPGIAMRGGVGVRDASDKETQAIDAAWGILHSAGRAQMVQPPIIGGLSERVTAKARATGGGADD